jgi:hypothetical protein
LWGKVTTTLLGYIDRLISGSRIPNWDHALGLYVIGRIDANLSQLKNAIVAEKRLHQLRLISINSLLSLAELMESYDVEHKEVLSILQPAGPVIDDMVDLITRTATEEPVQPLPITPAVHIIGGDDRGQDDHLFLLTPVADEPEVTAEEAMRSLLDQGWYVFGERTPGRKRLKRGDRICFYNTGIGVVAEATVDSKPEKKPIKFVRDPSRFPWAFHVKDVRYFFDKPVVIDATLRSHLEAFKGREPDKSWAWFVQGTHYLTEYDYKILVGHTRL